MSFKTWIKQKDKKKYPKEGREKFFKRTICGLIEIYDVDLSSCIFVSHLKHFFRIFPIKIFSLHNSFWYASCELDETKLLYVKWRIKTCSISVSQSIFLWKLLLTTTFLDLLIKILCHYAQNCKFTQMYFKINLYLLRTDIGFSGWLKKISPMRLDQHTRIEFVFKTNKFHFQQNKKQKELEKTLR